MNNFVAWIALAFAMGLHGPSDFSSTTKKRHNQSRATWIISAAIVLMIALSIFSYLRIEKQNDLENAVNHAYHISVELEKTNSALKHTEALLTIVFVSNDTSTAGQLERNEARVTRHINMLDQLVVDPVQKERMEKLHRVLKERTIYLENALLRDPANLKLYIEQIKNSNSRVATYINSLLRREDDLLKEGSIALAEYKRITPIALLMVKLLIIGILFLAYRHIAEALRMKTKLQADLEAQQVELVSKNLHLQQREQFLKSVQNASMHLLAVYDDKRRFISFNKKCEEVTGKKAEEVIGKTYLEVWPERKYSPVYNDLERAFSGEAVHNAQYESEASGRYFESQVVPLFDEKGQLYCVIAMSHEITPIVESTTKLEHLNRELMQQKDFAETILDHSVDCIFVLDRGLRFMSFNSRGKQIFGMTDEMIGARITDIFPRVNGSKTYTGLLQALAGNHHHIEKHQSVVVDKILESFFIPLKRGGAVYAVLLIHHDITELAKTSEKLLDRNIQLERSNAELEQFAYVASHDLQEPLRKIKTFTSLLESNLHHELKARDYLKKIFTSASRMSVLIKDVLSYSRVNGVFDHSFKPVDLNQILAEVKADLELVIENRNAVIHSSILPVVRGSYPHLTQVFLNLINNAIKFCVNEPVIEISSSVERRRFGSDKEETSYHVIAFKDNGIGFDEKFQHQIFEVFKRLHHRTEYEGTGIGLSICKRIIEQHHGHISAVSEVSVGSTFIVYLPATASLQIQVYDNIHTGSAEKNEATVI